jgi:hypothetical protein
VKSIASKTSNRVHACAVFIEHWTSVGDPIAVLTATVEMLPPESAHERNFPFLKMGRVQAASVWLQSVSTAKAQARKV